MRIEFLLAVANSKSSVSRRLVLAADQCAIGRQDGDLRLSDPLVSRMHAIIYFDPNGRLLVKDLDSTNGTWVNDVRIAEQPLNRGDEIRVGDTAIVLVQAEPTRNYVATTEMPPLAGEGDDQPTERRRNPLRDSERKNRETLKFRKADARKSDR